MSKQVHGLPIRQYPAGDIAMDRLILLLIASQMGESVFEDEFIVLAVHQGWMNYFDMIENLHELCNSGLMDFHREFERNYYGITGAGIGVLDRFRSDISLSIRDKVAQYLQSNRPRIRKEASVYAHIISLSTIEYLVKMTIVEDGRELFCLHVPADTHEQAVEIRQRFLQEGSKIYADLVHKLIDNKYMEKKEDK